MEKKYGENEKEEVEGDEERDFELLCGESRERKKRREVLRQRAAMLKHC